MKNDNKKSLWFWWLKRHENFISEYPNSILLLNPKCKFVARIKSLK